MRSSGRTSPSRPGPFRPRVSTRSHATRASITPGGQPNVHRGSRRHWLVQCRFPPCGIVSPTFGGSYNVAGHTVLQATRRPANQTRPGTPFHRDIPGSSHATETREALGRFLGHQCDLLKQYGVYGSTCGAAVGGWEGACVAPRRLWGVGAADEWHERCCEAVHLLGAG